MEEMYEQQSQLKDDHSAFVLLDTIFHMYLAELSQNRRLYRMMRSLTDQFNWFGLSALKWKKRLDQSFYEHAQIIEGLKAKDFARTKKAIQEHIENTHEAVIYSLRESTF